MTVPRRDWLAAVAHHHGRGCRVCGSQRRELAHTLGRVYDLKRGKVRVVHPLSVVPLCAEHHRAFDEHRLDLAPFLTAGELSWAVGRVGHGRAMRRLSGRDWAEKETA